MSDHGRADPLEAAGQACIESTGVTGGSISVMTSSGHRGVAWASSNKYAELEDLQFTLGDGPGVAAFQDQTPLMAAGIDDDHSRRWPAWAHAASAAGVRAVFAFPLRIGTINLGCFTLYCDRTGGLTREQSRSALRTADTIAVLLLERIVHTAIPVNGIDHHEDGHMPYADLYRASVNQAAGMVSVQLGVGIDEALARIRAHAFATERTLTALARDILNRTVRLEKDNPGRDA